MKERAWTIKMAALEAAADFLQHLGFYGVAVGVRHMYLATDFPKIKAAIIEHLRSVK